VAIFTHQFQLLFRECDYPKGFMVWIGLHGVMFLFLFSDFYKAKYLNAARRRRQAVKANGHANGLHSNGHSKHVGEGDTLVANGSNTGACMVGHRVTADLRRDWRTLGQPLSAISRGCANIFT